MLALTDLDSFLCLLMKCHDPLCHSYECIQSLHKCYIATT
uniref:Uncharacterized protein n=1 Tax=Anguilla anguilla TaxID=7936 RepID=A0A0E9WTJ1_ANGAN